MESFFFLAFFMTSSMSDRPRFAVGVVAIPPAEVPDAFLLEIAAVAAVEVA